MALFGCQFLKFAPEQRFRDGQRGIQRLLPVKIPYHFRSQSFLCRTQVRRLCLLLFQFHDFLRCQEGKFLQILAHFGILCVEQELVQIIGTGLFGIQPDCSGFGFPELGPSALVISGMVRP